MSVSGINFSGLSSGIDSASIIQKLVQLARQPETVYQNSANALVQRQTAYQTVSAKLLAFQNSAQTLNRLRAFNAVTATSSDSTIATATAATGTQAGQYNITVNNLATAQQISSTVQSSQTAPLGFEGQIVINGTAVTVHATDSLQTLAANINGGQTGVTASIIQPSSGQFYLNLGSSNTGVQGKISLADSAGGAFLTNTLGFFDASGATTLRNPIGTTGAASNLFSDSGTSVGTLIGLTNPPAGNIIIGGQAISIDLAHDSLSTIASKINLAGVPGVAASVVPATDPITGTTRQQLQITGTQTLTDSNHVLADLGVVQQNLASGREVTKAQDASFTLNGLAATRPTNSITDAVSGLSLTLVKAGSAVINVASDTSTIKSNIAAFVQTFNDVLDTVDNNSQYDATSGKSGPLLGDVVAQNLTGGLVSAVTDPVAGVNPAYNSLAQIGINLNSSGRLEIDDTKLSAALSGNNLSDIAKLFRADGTASDNAVKFVSSSTDTQASGVNGYDVVITQAATQANYTAGSAQTQPLAQDEVLTFGGPLFGTSSTPPFTGGKTITLAAGSTLQDVVSTINANTGVNKFVSASIVNGKLALTSKSYGSSAEFAVTSGVADAGDGASTGIGSGVHKAVGVDVAGTINGEEAKGVGQFLTGSKGSDSTAAKTTVKGHALGLQLLITATSPGNYGKVVFTSGVADAGNTFGNAHTDGYSGFLTNAYNEAGDEVADAKQNIANIEVSVKNYEAYLKVQYAHLETAVAQLQASSSGLSSLSGSSTTKTGTTNTSG